MRLRVQEEVLTEETPLLETLSALKLIGCGFFSRFGLSFSMSQLSEKLQTPAPPQKPPQIWVQQETSIWVSSLFETVPLSVYAQFARETNQLSPQIGSVLSDFYAPINSLVEYHVTFTTTTTLTPP